MKKGLSLLIVLTLLLAFSSVAAAQEVEHDFREQTVSLGYPVDLIERHFSEPEDEAWLREVEQMFNANIESVTTTNTQTEAGIVEYLRPQVMAGETDVDILVTTSHAMYSAASEGLLMPLDDFLDEEYWDSLPPTIIRDMHIYPPDGSYYTFQSNHFFSYDMLNTHGIWWNKDLFEDRGLQNPYELYEAGEWTWENFKDIAIDATIDETGDGETDIWGFAIRAWNWQVFTSSLRAWGHSNDASPVRVVDGRTTFTMDEPEMMETIEFLQDLIFEEGAAQAQHPGEMGEFADGNIAMLQGPPDAAFRLHEEQEMEEDYSFLPMPMGPRTNEHRATATHQLNTALPITVDDPAGLIALHNALYRVTEEWRIEDSWDEEIESWAERNIMGLRDQESLETYYWIFENTDRTIGYINFWIPEYEDSMSRILEDGESPSAVVDGIKTATQSYLDDVFN